MKNKKISVTIQELQSFGILFGVIIVLLFGVFLPWLLEKKFPLFPWLVLACTGGLAVIHPLTLSPFYKLWMLFGEVMGWINTRLMLGLVFYLIFVPFALVLKLLGKDSLARKFDRRATTYRIINNEHDKKNMEDPF